MAQDSEKRRIVRNSFLQKISLQVTREMEGRLEFLEGSGYGIDINSHGLGLKANLPLLKGDVVKAQIPSMSEGTFLPVLSQVVWSRKENSEFRVGLRFLS